MQLKKQRFQAILAKNRYIPAQSVVKLYLSTYYYIGHLILRSLASAGLEDLLDVYTQKDQWYQLEGAGVTQKQSSVFYIKESKRRLAKQYGPWHGKPGEIAGGRPGPAL